MSWKIAIFAGICAYIIITGIVLLSNDRQAPLSTVIEVNDPLPETIVIAEPPRELNPRLSQSLPVEEITPDGSLTITEILQRASEGDGTACQVKEDFIKEACLEKYYFITAERTEDPLLCLEARDPDFIDRCMANAAIIAVAVAYYNESEMLTKEVTASNIALCDALRVAQDRELCRNPKLAIERDYNQVRYRLP